MVTLSPVHLVTLSSCQGPTREAIFAKTILVGRAPGQWFCDIGRLRLGLVRDHGVLRLAKAGLGGGNRCVRGDSSDPDLGAADSPGSGREATARLVEVLATQAAKEGLDA